jgi:23S rRNA pseudouridine955/2504/2580 synthase
MRFIGRLTIRQGCWPTEISVRHIHRRANISANVKRFKHKKILVSMSEKETEQSGYVRHVTVDADSAGQRLDNYLLRELKGVPRTRIYRAFRKGEVRVNKGRTKADYRVKAGDVLRIPPIRLPKASEPAVIPRRWSEILRNSIVYEDKGLLVINKPSGLAVHGGSGLNYGLIECLRQTRPEDKYLELIHRIDRDTSGCVMVAKRRPVLREIHRQLRASTVDKRYLALVRGHWPKHNRVIDAPLFKYKLPSGENRVRVAKEGKEAMTRFSVLERYDNATLIEARPVTGRTHQIRVHAQHAGHPLLGDEKYSSDDDSQFCAEIGLKRLFLHAQSLSFRLPEEGRMSFEAPLDPILENILTKLRK